MSLPGARAVLVALTDLVFPDSCPGCGERALPPACAGCLAALARAPRPAPPDPSPPGLPAPWAVARYAGSTRALIVAHKERGRLALAAPLGAALGRATLAAAQATPVRVPPVVLIPVPSVAAATRRRGHDPTARLARQAAHWLQRRGVPAHVLNALRHARTIDDQAGLTHAERARNLSGALVARPPSLRPRPLPAGARLVLVDDVVTTGATLAEGVRALRAADLPVAGVAVVAATQRQVRLPSATASG